MAHFNNNRMMTAMITVRKLLKEPCLCQTKIMAGSKGLDRAVTKFGVLDAPDSTNYTSPGEFVVSSGFLFKDNMDLQLEVVRKLISIGASAWALKFERYDIVLSDEVYELANISHFPIIAVPQNVTWYEIAKLIVSADGQKKAELSTVYTMTENFLSLTRSLINLSDLPPMIYDYFGYVCAMYNMIDQTQRVCPDDGISTNTILGVLMNYEHSNSPPNGRAAMQNLTPQPTTIFLTELCSGLRP